MRKRNGRHYSVRARAIAAEPSVAVAANMAAMDDNKRVDRIEERLDRLDEQTRQEVRPIDVRLTRIETRLDQAATKTDLQQAMDSMRNCREP